MQIASADVESYALRGERYTALDLAAAATAGDITLVGLVADLTLVRPEELDEMQERVDEASRMVLAIIESEDREYEVDALEAIETEAEMSLSGMEDSYRALVEELGICPMCGGTGQLEEHDHDGT